MDCTTYNELITRPGNVVRLCPSPSFIYLFSPDLKNEKGGWVILEHDVYTYDTETTWALVSLHYWN